jgi:anthranilate/para-aminobenzoate synthase component II
LAVTAYTMEGEVMGLAAPEMNLYGVQFHPESIATAQGMLVFRNFLALCGLQEGNQARACA